MEDFTVFETKTELVFNKDIFRQYDFYKVTEAESNISEIWQLLANNGDTLDFLIRGSLGEGCLNRNPIIRIVNHDTPNYKDWFKNLKVERIEFGKVIKMLSNIDEK